MQETTFLSRLKRAWNTFMNKDPTYDNHIGLSSSSRPDRPRLSRGME